jgi:hypothetical protein
VLGLLLSLFKKDFSMSQQFTWLTICTTKNLWDDPSFAAIDETTTHVHIRGHLFIWSLARILLTAPNLRIIQIIPSVAGKISDKHHSLCELKGVKITTGHIAPDLAWEEGEIRSPDYKKNLATMKGLSGDQKTLLEELVFYGEEAALIASRYFCLSGEEYLSQGLLAVEFGYSERLYHYMSTKILAVTGLFDTTVGTTARVTQLRTNMLRRLEIYRERFSTQQKRIQNTEAIKVRYGVAVASNYPAAAIIVLERILEQRLSKDFTKFKMGQPKAWRIIELRYGFDTRDNATFRTLQEVGDIIGITRERVRQLIEKAFLGLKMNDMVEDKEMAKESQGDDNN